MNLPSLVSAIFIKLTSLLVALVVIFMLAATGGATQVVHAGTNLVVTCANQGPCTVLPAATPLFYETNLIPGQTRAQTLTVINLDSDDTCQLGLTIPSYAKPGGQAVDLESQLFASIHSGATTYFGSFAAGEAQPGVTYQDLYITHQLVPLGLGTIAPGSNRVYNWTATFNSGAGNEYQGVESVFDFQLALSCTGGPTPPPGGSTGPSSPSGTSGSTSPASPPVCNATSPSTVTGLQITAVGSNTVSLSWNPASPVTHYAVTFTRTSDGAQYGSPNIGNVTSYTVTNLSGGANYSFQVFAVNECKPGERSAVASTGVVPGPFIGGRPTGPSGEVLGEQVEVATPSSTPTGQVAGLTDETTPCASWRVYLPLVLLIMQLLFVLLTEYYFRRDEGWTKHFLTIGITIVSIVLFYLLRECACLFSNFWLTWLCKWYWLVALLLTGVVRAIGYAFIEEIEDKKEKKAIFTETKKTDASKIITDTPGGNNDKK